MRDWPHDDLGWPALLPSETSLLPIHHPGGVEDVAVCAGLAPNVWFRGTLAQMIETER